MRLFRLSTAYPEYLAQFYARRPALGERPYAEQKRALDADAFGWAGAWKDALAPLGYEMEESWVNAVPLQRAWAAEGSGAGGTGGGRPSSAALREIAFLQVRAFRPDVLWFDHTDEPLLQRVRREVPSVRRVLGWSGSAIPETGAWREMDLVLSCAPESVERFRANGLKAEVLHHAFIERVADGLEERPPRRDVAFIGQIVNRPEFHERRAALLLELAGLVPLEIFGPGAARGGDGLRAAGRPLLHAAARALRALGVADSALRRWPLVGRAAGWRETPRALPPALRRMIRPACYGLEMFQTLRDSRITLNIHADSSPRFASNMRLFEATGVGSCLLTDWRENVAELFEPGREIVTYRDAEECAERVRWLLEHPAERAGLAAAGRARTLRDHTFRQRAHRLDELIRSVL